jgi:hypothetical protein
MSPSKLKKNHWTVGGGKTTFCWVAVSSVAFSLGPAPTGTGTIALDPTFGSFTLLEPVSH